MVPYQLELILGRIPFSVFFCRVVEQTFPTERRPDYEVAIEVQIVTLALKPNTNLKLPETFFQRTFGQCWRPLRAAKGEIQ
jgi:hypothetical protein